MYEFYEEFRPTEVLKRSRKALKNLYESIPETEGCMENLSNCHSWCCQIQNPQVMYSEFLNTWNHVTHNWTKNQIITIIAIAMRTYISGGTTKGCVFWDHKSKLCKQHETRPFNCRAYGQIPEEEFKPRYEQLKILYANKPDADLRPQCGLVRSKNPTVKQMDEWFTELKFIEQDIGIHPKLISDHVGGSYRAYHDHILLHVCSDKFLMRAVTARAASEDAKAGFMYDLIQRLEKEVTDLTRIKL